jgi:hypothetical protein
MMDKYTLVAHTGLPNAVELRSVGTKAKQDRILKLGGILFDSYAEASEAEMAVNYPSPERDDDKGPGWIHPGVKGRFSKSKVDYQRLYLPSSLDRQRIKKALAKKENS